MSDNQQLIIQDQMVSGGDNPVAQVARTSRMLAEAETIEDFVDVRKQAEVVADVFRDLKVQQQLRFEAACMMIRAEHALGRLLARLPLAKGSPGNQRTGKVDRSHDGTGPIRLEDIGISKNASQRAQRITRISVEDMEKWLAEQCAKGKEPTLDGAKQLANKLQPANLGAKTGKPGKPKKNDKPPCMSSQDVPGGPNFMTDGSVNTYRRGQGSSLRVNPPLRRVLL